MLVVSPMSADAAAQSGEPPRLTVSAGGGIANPMHGDFDFIAPEWQVAVRGRLADGVMFEGFVSEWRHRTEDVRLNQSITGPSGLITRAGRFRQETVRATRVIGINVLGGATAGRVLWWAGGGIGSMDFRRDYTQSTSECVPDAPQVCTEFRNRYAEGTFSFQAVAGFDVRVARRLLAYGQYLLAVPIQDPGSGHNSFTGGVRFVLF